MDRIGTATAGATLPPRKSSPSPHEVDLAVLQAACLDGMAIEARTHEPGWLERAARSIYPNPVRSYVEDQDWEDVTPRQALQLLEQEVPLRVARRRHPQEPTLVENGHHLVRLAQSEVDWYRAQRNKAVTPWTRSIGAAVDGWRLSGPVRNWARDH